MQWQHGSYVVASDGTVTLTPIEVDGRQLVSEPCGSQVGVYTRYNNTEHFKVGHLDTMSQEQLEERETELL